jgi:hypothetical protein
MSLGKAIESRAGYVAGPAFLVRVDADAVTAMTRVPITRNHVVPVEDQATERDCRSAARVHQLRWLWSANSTVTCNRLEPAEL